MPNNKMSAYGENSKIRMKHHTSWNLEIIVVFLITLLVSIPISLLAQQPNLYRNKTHTFRITFPDGWTQESGYGPNAIVKATSKTGESINVVVTKLPGEKTLDDFSEKGLNTIINGQFNKWKEAFPDVVFQGHGVTHLSNKKAIWFSLTCSYSHIVGTYKMKLLQIVSFYKGKSYDNVWCTGEI